MLDIQGEAWELKCDLCGREDWTPEELFAQIDKELLNWYIKTPDEQTAISALIYLMSTKRQLIEHVGKRARKRPEISGNEGDETRDDEDDEDDEA